MDPRVVVASLFAVVLVYVAAKAVGRPLAVLGRVLAQAVLGLVFLKAWDLAATRFGWPPVGLNALTAAVMGVLGFPGFLSLLAIRYGLS